MKGLHIIQEAVLKAKCNENLRCARRHQNNAADFACLDLTGNLGIKSSPLFHAIHAQRADGKTFARERRRKIEGLMLSCHMDEPGTFPGRCYDLGNKFFCRVCNRRDGFETRLTCAAFRYTANAENRAGRNAPGIELPTERPKAVT